MASTISISIFLFFSFLPLSLSSILLPISKDPLTAHYLALIHHGTPLAPAHLLLDLSSPFLWVHCASSNPTPLTCRSIQCSTASSSAACPSASDPPCALPLRNPVTGASTSGDLVEDTLVFSSPGQTPVVAVDDFLMSCAPSSLLHGLVRGARGVLGFGRTRTGAPEQISHFFGYPKKFSLCLSSLDGMIAIPSGQATNFDFSKSLIYTPLLNGDDEGYSINLKAIQIQNKRLSLGLQNKNSPSGTVKINTISQYSAMESGIYEVFVRAFTRAAESLNLTSVPGVAPFGACFRSGSDSGSVPVIDLILQSDMVKWRIHGHNSLVKVSDDVLCLGFLDGGDDLGASIVLGGHQLEDNLLEFDLGSSMLGFSSSLVMKQSSCSRLTSSTLHQSLQAL